MRTRRVLNSDSHRHYLREWRLAKGLTQEELGAKVGSFKGIISRYETGDRGISLDMMSKLWKALGITPGQFFAPPDRPSLDALVEGKETELLRRLEKMVRVMVDGP